MSRKARNAPVRDPYSAATVIEPQPHGVWVPGSASQPRDIHLSARRKNPLDGVSKPESDFKWTKRVTLQAIRKDEARRAPSRRDMRSARWLRIGRIHTR